MSAIGLQQGSKRFMGVCQNYGPFLGPYYNTAPIITYNLGYPKRDLNFDNHPHEFCSPHQEYAADLEAQAQLQMEAEAMVISVEEVWFERVHFFSFTDSP